MKRFNDQLADLMSAWMSQMWLFWLLTILILGALIFQRPQGIQGWALFFVSVFFQGVALVVINYTSDKQGRQTLKLLQETHDTTMEELSGLRRLYQTQSEELAELRELHKEVHVIVTNIQAGTTVKGGCKLDHQSLGRLQLPTHR